MIRRSSGMAFAYRREWRLPSSGFLTRFHASIGFVWDRIRSIRKLIGFRRALSERVVTGFE
jgi:hypothetical protein